MRSCVHVAALLALHLLVALLAVAGAPLMLHAQSARQPAGHGVLFDGDIASIKIDGYARASLTSLGSSLWGTNGRFSGIGTASLARFETGSTTGYGELHGSFALSSDRRNISAIRADAGAGAYRGETSSRYGEASLTLGRSSERGAVAGWLDAGVGRVDAVSVRNTSHARLGASVQSASATLGGEIGTVASGSLRYSEAVMHAQLALLGSGPSGIPRLVIGGDGGVRSADDLQGRHAWALGVATVRLGGPVSLIGYAGAQPPDPTRGTLGAAYASIGLRIALGASGRDHAPAVISSTSRATSVSAAADDGRRMISVSLESARSVEIMGDFTGWLPVTMVRSPTGKWQVRIPLEQGSHRAEVRADSGAWVPAPGLPVATDEFGGSVGILVVP
ncbi:MAG TPA: glycogen-binding domain-containing protein [Gemmatimonadaceae bacterium]|nr:glycogen-binding domain-containing protein [Gemmatimonadaceae bacterium]